MRHVFRTGVLLGGAGLVLTGILGGTCGGGGSPTAIVYGVTPAEVKLPSDSIYIKGRNFDQGSITVFLQDPSDPGAALPNVNVIHPIQPHSIRVDIQSFATSRRKYQIVVRQDNLDVPESVPGKSSYVFLRTDGGVPNSKKVQIQYINWGWVFQCDSGFDLVEGTTRRNSTLLNGGQDCSTELLSGGFPQDDPDFEPGIWPQAGPDNPADGLWPEWTRFVDQSSRDWATVCSEVWNPGSTKMLNGFEEVAPRITLVNNLMFWFDAGTNPETLQVRGLGSHRVYEAMPCPSELESCQPENDPGTGCHVDEQKEWKWCGCDDMYTNDNTLSNEQPACNYWPDLKCDSPGCGIVVASPPRIEVHIVGMFFQNKSVVNPRDAIEGFRAVTNPGFRTDTNNMILISDNKDVEGRANPDLNAWPNESIVPWGSGNGDLSKLIDPAQRGWWGPSEDRDITPNLLSHELLHALTGILHSGPDPDDTLLVQLDLADCPTTSDPAACELQAGRRGFRMDIPTQNFTADQVCGFAKSSDWAD